MSNADGPQNRRDQRPDEAESSPPDDETPLNPLGDLRDGDSMISPHRALMGLLKSMVGRRP
uniref:Uncharacterized protein n=1 Tax=Romanomermis culicivorax TaxID=13658 RepID=A0A915KIA4_ROMCU